MAEKSVDTIVADVRVCLDEIGANEAEFLLDADSEDMNAVIKSKISDAIRSAADHIVDPSLECGATGQSSSIIKVGLDYSIEIIRK